MPSYTGHPPYLDEYQERLDNAEHLQSGAFGAKQVVLYDSSGSEVISAGSAATIGDGRKTVTTAGTRVQLSSSSVSCKSVTIVALKANTDAIVIGGVTVIASESTRRGAPVYALDSIKLFVTNLNAVWIDSLVNGEGVSYVYEA